MLKRVVVASSAVALSVAATVALAVPALTVPALTARADTPFSPAAQVTDRVGALSTSQLTSVQAALASLYAKDKLKLFVVYVKDFSGQQPTSWVDQSAALGGMGRRDLLLGVATGARQYAVSADPDSGLTGKQLDDVAATAIEPALRASDWAAAATGAAGGYAAVLAGRPIPVPAITPGAAATGTKSSGSGAGVAIAVVAIIVLLGLLLFFFLRRRKADDAGQVPEPGGLTTAQLEAKAGHLLVATDDAIMTSEQELGFAAAQFGDEATAPFAAAMESAKGELAAAFKLRQLLDDDIPEDAPTTRRMLEELCAHCERANSLLDEQAAAFDKLRNLEASAPQIIAQLTASAQQRQSRLATARSMLAQLSAQYAPSAFAPVASNADEAASRLEFVQGTLHQAQQASSAGDNSQAAVLVQAAQSADDQVTQLLDGVDRRSSELSEASSALTAALTATEANIAEAAASGQPGLREPAVRAQTVAAQVRSMLGAGPADPLEGLRAVEEANSQLDQALAGVREAQVRQQRARESLQQTVLTARSSIAAANDFITTNRGGVGSTARTRVAEAQRHLDRALALAATDAESSVAEAQQADAMASQAYREAQQDVSGFAGAGQGTGGIGQLFGGGNGGSGAAGTMGAVLGGILINSVLNGGGGGARGGSGRAAPPAAGSYGGASTRGRNSVGGRFLPGAGACSGSARASPGASRSRVQEEIRTGGTMSKQTIFGRVTQMAKANINAMLDSAEDPGKMLDQLIRDYSNNISEAEQSIAQTIGNLRMMEDDQKEDVRAAQEWGSKAMAASQRADQFRTAGQSAEADKFDNLAKVAIGKQMAAEKQVKDAQATLDAQRDVTDKLKAGLDQMKSKLTEMKTKRDSLIARAKTAQAQNQVQQAVKSVDILDPTSEVSRFEEKVRREEARVRGAAELASSSLDSQFESLSNLGDDMELEARLAALKSGGAAPAAAAPPAAAPAAVPAPAPAPNNAYPTVPTT